MKTPLDILRFLTETRLKLIEAIRLHPGSISYLAIKTHRNRAAVSRDIAEMEKFGLLKTRKEVNPGHGVRKVVSLASQRLYLRAAI